MPCVDRKHAAKYEKEFLDDLQRLGCLMPSLLTRVSDFIPEIRAYIDKIHENGMAYANNGSVYFDTQAFRCNLNTDDKHSSSLTAVYLSNLQNLSFSTVQGHKSQHRSSTALKQASAVNPTLPAK